MKIAIVSNKLIVGGVEKALINLLKSDMYKDDQIDLYLMDTSGCWMNKLPSNINVIKIQMEKLISISKPIETIKNVFNYFCLKKSKSFIEECFYSCKLYKKVDKIYDEVISYHSPGGISVFFTLLNLKSKIKTIYIHGDIKKCGSTSNFIHKHYKQYDYIKCVSKDSYNVFVDVFSDLKNKTSVEYNLINRKEISELSYENCIELDNCSFSILTVGRLSNEKGIDLAIMTLNKIKEKHKNVKWYVCGEGEEREKLEKLICKYSLEKDFILLGSTNNPYKYMRKCNLYVQPSKHEGYCITLAEALLIKEFAISTKFSGAFEQIQSGINGFIVDYDVEALSNKICEIIEK